MELDLPSFIRAVGIDESAKLFDAKPGAVKCWLYRERYPKRETGLLIAERTKDHPAGSVSFEAIYAPPPQPQQSRAAA